MKSAAKPHFPVLSGLRGVAALYVALGHIGPMFGGWIKLPMAHAGLDLFFLLSGVVIESSYSDRLRDGRMSFYDFVKVRMIRIYPVYILGTLIMMMVMLRIGASSPLFHTPHTLAYVEHPAIAVPAAILMVPLFKYADVFPFDPPAWSLFFELMANFAYAACIRQLPTKRLIIIVVLCFFASAFGRTYLSWVALQSTRVGFSFGLGLILFRLYRRESNRHLPPGFQWALLVVAAFLLNLQSEREATLVVAVGFPIIIYAALHGKTGNSVFEFLGNVSYPLYLLHVPVLFLIVCVFHIYILAIGVIYIPFMIVLSWWIYKYFDTPSRRFLRARFQPTETSVIATKIGY